MLDLPPKSSFEPPRYPNAWLYVSEQIAPTYRDAATFVISILERHIGFEDSLPPTGNLECADAQRRVHHIQPVTGLPDPARNHYHDLHIRYYFRHLPRREQHHAIVQVDGKSYACWRLPTSVHYEPESESPHHPYVDECPICGVFSPYDLPGDRCEVCHDPMGLELLFFGTVRGETVLRADGLPVGGLKDLATHYAVRLSIHEPSAPYMNTLRIGIAMFLARRDEEGGTSKP
jgi:hypothetical protein